MQRLIEIRSVARNHAIASDVLHFPLRFCDPLVIRSNESPGAHGHGIVHRSSGTLIRIGGKTCAIVRQHALEIYRRKLNDGIRYEVLLLDQPIDPSRRVIDEDSACDLAVLDVSDLRIARSDETTADNVPPLSVYAPPRSWPRSDLLEDDLVLFAGWPEIDDAGDQAAHWFSRSAFVAARVQVTDVSSRRITCRFDRNEWRSLWNVDGMPELGSRRTHGLTGVPVFSDPGRTITDAQLVGFIADYDENLDVLHVTAATAMKSDGTFWH